MDNKKNVSVIIPAFNEELHIANTLQSLMHNGDALEIIVVDNGSSDRTADIASSACARVIELPEGTIAAVRNRGVKAASGDVLVFIDADIQVAPDWHEKLQIVLQKLQTSPLMVTGSRVQSIEKDNWLHRYWFSELTNYSAPYINSGHLITSRQLFDNVQGFTESLETAEDYDFCQKAVKAGATIENYPALVAMHEGYPETLRGFVLRERWHGRQDVASWQLFLDSKIAWFAALNLILFIMALIATLIGWYLALPIYLLVMYAVSFMLTLYKFGVKKITYMLVMPVIFYFYLCGRSLALLDRLTGRTKS